MDIKSFAVYFAIVQCTAAAIGTKPKDIFGTCGLEQTGTAGTIASPNFPNKYPPMAKCNYTVTVPEDAAIKFEFVYMDMEDGPIQKLSGCFADYIVITEVNTEESSMVGNQRFCGYDTGFNPVFTRGNQAYIWFRSDDTIEREGFVLKWTAVKPRDEAFDCTFEAKQGFCEGWRQLEPRDIPRWKINRGVTRSSRMRWSTGPMFDHTKKTNAGSYVYAEATDMRNGEVTTLISPPVSIMKTERYCLSFWYHMYGSGIGTLNVYEMQTDGRINGFPKRGAKIFFVTGEQGKSWMEAKITLNRKPVATRFIFEVIRGRDYRGDIALDDIRMEEDGCQEPK